MEDYKLNCINFNKELLLEYFNNINSANKQLRFNDAISYGNLYTIKFLKETYNIGDCLTQYSAIQTTNLDIIKYCIDIGIQFNSDGFDYAVKSNAPIEFLEKLKEMNIQIGLNSVSYAIENKNINVLKWLKRNRAPVTRMIYRFARATGDSDIIEYISTEYNNI